MRKFALGLFCSCLLVFWGNARDARGDTLDIVSCRLNMDLSDFAGKILHAEATLGIKSKMSGVSAIRLDLLRLTIDSVKVNTYNTVYDYNDTVVNINLLTTLQPGDSATIQLFYHGHPVQMPGDFGGFYWNSLYAFNIGVSFLENPHCYGRVWFPCFDNFEERSYFEFYITTKNNQKAFCNGLLEGVTQNATTKTWHWKLQENIPSYLASVAVSDYQTLTDTVHAANGIIPIELAARSTDTIALKNLFRHLKDAFHIQENLWGAYQWERVGYCILPFNAGAMEHATNIGFMQYYLNSYANSCETTMAHELSHHWFGDLVTCDNASEMWLNEGWAAYNETLFLENFYGADSAKEYQRLNHENVLHRAHVSDGAYLPVNGVPSDKTYGATVYDKGSDVVHTLRFYMNDQDFFHCMKNYLSDLAYTHSSTQQLMDYLNQCSGKNLTPFFDDWVNAPGFPHFSIEKWQTQQTDLVNVATDVYIRQRLSHAPHYYTLVPVTITYYDKYWTRYDEVVYISDECTHHQLILPNFTPVYVALDFHEKIQDAITDEWKVLTDTGTYDFGTAKIKIDVTGIQDSALVRVEHNWIAPDAMKNPISGLHLHDSRYWTVDGIFDSTFRANAVINYDGTAGAYLDNTFFTNSEDSLVLMYRPDQTTDWEIADSFSINTQGNPNDKLGTITVPHLKKGEYAMAIQNATLLTESDSRVSCLLQTGIQKTEESDFEVFPNPANDNVTVRFQQNIFDELWINDLRGRNLITRHVPSQEPSVIISLKALPKGIYFITLKEKTAISITKKIIKE